MFINIDEVKEAVGANEVLFAQTVGSKLCGITNPKDEDVIIVVDKKNEKWRYYLDNKDVFVFTNKEYVSSIKEEESFIFYDKTLRGLCSLLNYEAAKVNLRGSILYGECENKIISLYDNKKLAFERTLRFGDDNFFNPRIHNKNGNHGCGKLMSWALWYYYAFQNGSLELTSEQQNTIQLCHDGNLPIEYAKDLREKIIKYIEK